MANIARRFAALFIAHAASVVLAAPARAAGTADAAVIPFTPDRWTLSEGIKVVEHRGVQAIEIPRLPTRPEAVLKGLTFTNGTIEVDVEGTTGLGPSIGFHRRDSATYELFYVRPQPECATKPDCVQYAPVTKNVLLWDIYPEPQAPARYVPGQWNHVKLVVSGRRLRVWVNGGAPALDVTRLEGDAHEGAIVLQGTGFLANVKVTPGAVEGLDPRPGPDPTAKDARYVRNWMVSPVSTLAARVEKPELRDAPSQRQRMGAAARRDRRPGEHQPALRPARRPLARVAADHHPRRREEREARGHRLERRGLGLRQRQAGLRRRERLPEAGTAQEAGRTAVARERRLHAAAARPATTRSSSAVANAFFGWGLMLRLDDAAGVTLTASTR